VADDGEFAGAFVTGFCSVYFDKDTLTPNFKKGGERVRRAIDTVFQYMAPQIESSAKLEAPWTDQTGNARQGLRAVAGREGNAHYIALFHQVPYGIYLETRFSGRYAIIFPTLESWTPRVIQELNGLIGKDIFK
jgi:hypothetical protein